MRTKGVRALSCWTRQISSVVKAVPSSKNLSLRTRVRTVSLDQAGKREIWSSTCIFHHQRYNGLSMERLGGQSLRTGGIRALSHWIRLVGGGEIASLLPCKREHDQGHTIPPSWKPLEWSQPTYLV